MTKAEKIFHKYNLDAARQYTLQHATTQMKAEATTSSPNLSTAPGSEGSVSLQSQYNRSVA